MPGAQHVRADQGVVHRKDAGRALRVVLVLSLVVAVLAVPNEPAGASPAELDRACPGQIPMGFTDVGPRDTHAEAIGCLVAWSITTGLDVDRFGPDRPVTRGQMATFLVRLLRATGDPMVNVPEWAEWTVEDNFVGPHWQSINHLLAVGLVQGTQVGDRQLYLPDDPVTRAQMATFLFRVLDHMGATLPVAEPPFLDVSGGVHASAIGSLAAAGVVQGRSPDRYDPGGTVTRAQMATFLMRTADLAMAQGLTELPASLSGPLPGAPDTDVPGRDVASGLLHTCALPGDGGVACWGKNQYGELGDGTTQTRTSPVRVPGIDDAVEVGVGAAHTCVRHADGTVSCWGAGYAGQLGDGIVDGSWQRNEPFRVPGVTDTIGLALAVGSDTTCALHRDGGISCWGWGFRGELADGMTGPGATRGVPLRSPFVRDAVEVSLGQSHGCVRHRGQTLSCWGRWEYLGRPPVPDDPYERNEIEALNVVPMPVYEIDDALQVSAGGVTCALRSDGSVWCWGTNVLGAVGDGTDRPRPFPTRSGTIDDAVAVTASFGHTCALHADGTVSCWGDNRAGQLGIGEIGGLRYDPTPVIGLQGATTIDSGGSVTCARLNSGSLVCWGANGNGGVGDGTTETRPSPVPVNPFPPG